MRGKIHEHGETNKCNLREDETLAEVVEITNFCMIKVSRLASLSSLPLNIVRPHCFLGFLLNLLFLTFRTEAVAQRYSVKKVFLEIFQNSLENTCARASFLTKLQA